MPQNVCSLIFYPIFSHISFLFFLYFICWVLLLRACVRVHVCCWFLFLASLANISHRASNHHFHFYLRNDTFFAWCVSIWFWFYFFTCSPPPPLPLSSSVSLHCRNLTIARRFLLYWLHLIISNHKYLLRRQSWVHCTWPNKYFWLFAIILKFILSRLKYCPSFGLNSIWISDTFDCWICPALFLSFLLLLPHHLSLVCIRMSLLLPLRNQFFSPANVLSDSFTLISTTWMRLNNRRQFAFSNSSLLRSPTIPRYAITVIQTIIQMIECRNFNRNGSDMTFKFLINKITMCGMYSSKW